MYGDKEAKEAIEKLMKESNRPFNLQNILDNTGGKIKKALGQKIVDDLQETGYLSFKDYGKSRIYLVN